MPELTKTFSIEATADSLLLRAASHANPPRRLPHLRISYGAHPTITAPDPPPPAPHAGSLNVDDDKKPTLDAFGIVGLLPLLSRAYLIVITRREPVAAVHGHAVFAVRGVALVPLASRAEAERAIVAARRVFRTEGGGVGGPPAGAWEGVVDEGESEGEGDGDPAMVGEAAPALEPPQVEPSVLGKSARFAKDWLGRGATWGMSARKTVGKSAGESTGEQAEQAEPARSEHETRTKAGDGVESESAETAASKRGPGGHDEAVRVPTKQSAIESLTPRILRGAALFFSSGGFYFSHDHDLSRSLVQADQTPTSSPLWKRFDPTFFWNRHLLAPFIDAGQDTFALPLLQGFVGQKAFSLVRTDDAEPELVSDPASGVPTANATDQEHFLLTVISRRSVKRAGLRYLRRGIDDDGNVANSVETEQILSPRDGEASKQTFSLVQIRGSIPLFFSQSPYSFKPTPVLFGSEGTNQAAFRKHFETVAARFGTVQVASLVDKHGTEAGIGEAYERYAQLLNASGGIDHTPVGFEWFDFHGVCKGMKFSNVSILLHSLQSPLEAFGWSVRQDDRVVRRQTGVLRTNCMDCLDRTNVVQSAVGGWALQQQLAELRLAVDLQTDPKTQWFNELWADNGDAISKQYAGTAALKGDFTRTRRRNWAGALSDFSLTLTRYYNNMFGDYFLQTEIDYFLGHGGPSLFDDFQADMMDHDHALDMRRVRQHAIDTCITLALEDPAETPAARGWTLSCPRRAHTLRTLPFEECVLLLTDAALYFCRFDWARETLASFERVALPDIVAVWRGAYITSTLGPTHTDEATNVGFALRYIPRGRGALVRSNTRSWLNETAVVGDEGAPGDAPAPKPGESRLLAFKALPAHASAAKEPPAEEEAAAPVHEAGLTRHICEHLQRAMRAAAIRTRGFDHLQLDPVPEVEQRDVVSVAEARRGTGYVESIGYSLKKLVWS